MQLIKKGQSLKALLTAASCTLLGAQANAQPQDDKKWQFDTAFMYYSEQDRVSAAEAIISGTKEFDDAHFLNLKLTVDTLTGASANGAVAQPNVQTFTRPSGKGSFDVKAGETPLDDTFRDTRVQLNGQWSQPWAEDYTLSGGLHLSKEYDYLSLGLNGNIARDFNLKNTTASIGFSYGKDSIEPEGGIPKPFSFMGEISDAGAGRDNRIGSDDNKNTLDVLFGLTQVINRRMIMQLNYSLSKVSGYQTDPFKIVSVVDNQGFSQAQRYEHRPDSRTKNSMYWQTKYHLSDSIIDFSYRYFWDNWDVTSHTIDTRYRINLTSGYFEPHVRFYRQEAAEFYRPFLSADDALPTYMSADYRIGKFDALTIGAKYAIPLANGNELAFRLEFYQQSPKNHGVVAPGVLASVELYEPVKAAMFQVSYSFSL